jgi:hypothetical protein
MEGREHSASMATSHAMRESAEALMRTPARPSPRWPKGPFPEKYRFDPVEARLRGAWAGFGAAEALGKIAASGLAPHPEHEDPYLRLFIAPLGGLDVAAVRAELAGLPVLAFRFATSARDDLVTDAKGVVLGLVASTDPIDAVVAVGTAGPRHGIGTAAIVRFLATLKTFARWTPEEIGEERLRLSVVPREEDAVLRIAERVLKICPPLVRANVSAESLAERMRVGGDLELDWS